MKAYVSHKVTENDFILNITFDVQKPITSIKVLYQNLWLLYNHFNDKNNFKINPRLDVIKDEFDQNYEVNVISTTINMCNKNSFVKTNVIFRTMLGPFADGLVDAVTCPVKKVLMI